MTHEANRKTIVAHIARINAQDLEGAARDVAEDAVNHSAIPEAQGRAGYLRILTKLARAFPDMQMVCEDVIAENDKVVCRLTFSGTHTGALEFARMPLAATGKRFQSTHIHVYRLANGMIAERWAERDDLGMLRQLGLMPALGRAGATQDAVAS